MNRDTLTEQLTNLEGRRAGLDTYTKHWHGEQPAAFLTKKSRQALDGRLARVGMNVARLVIRSRVDRLRVVGFRSNITGEDAAGVWNLYRRAGLVSTSELVHTDRDLYGAAYVFVWSDARDDRRPVAMPHSPLDAAVETDPATGAVVTGLRKWHSRNATHAMLADRESVQVWQANTPNAPAGASNWQQVREVDNPFGVVPLVPFIRRGAIDDHAGTSAVADVLDLQDALAKVTQDSLVTSEFYARPRRWATGLEIEEDEDGNPVDPFGESRFLQSEAPDTKFGQLNPSGTEGHTELAAMITQQIGALTGLPSHYLGIHGDQPPNAESVRAAEAQLTSAAFSEQRQLEPSWSLVASLLHAVRHQSDPYDEDYSTVWASPEIRTPGQAADAAAKLHGIGVPLESLLIDTLGYEPDAARKITEARGREALTNAAAGLGRLTPGGAR